MLTLLVALFIAQTPPVITIDRDNIEITESCTIKIAANPIIDADNNGVIHITQDGITVDCANQALHGSPSQFMPNEFHGTGIKITAKNITLKNANISGYRVGIHAVNADGLNIHHCDLSNNFHQRLKSTPKAEDASDWLWPHHNDDNQWITNYGAGLCVEDSSNVTIHNIRARKTQNGIILDRVNDSKVYDCDCSFLSGWGLAMWRSNRNVISRNAFDFCVRGYSHGVYNRGQDSAGILMFEQCCENIIAENSATHCGDGFFGFAGKGALGETGGTGVPPVQKPEWYNRRGCNNNVLVDNNFSHSVAHGLEITFSSFNEIWGNRFVDNAICGIWGGYSQATNIGQNHFENNGEMAYGLERGGINIEHGWENHIVRNSFTKNACGIHLWWDDDGQLLTSPWAQANGTRSDDNYIEVNTFNEDRVAIHLRECDTTVVVENRFLNLRTEIEADKKSRRRLAQSVVDATPPDKRPSRPIVTETFGTSKPISARNHLAGRKNIILTEWGPWDHESPLLQFVQHFDTADEYKLRGTQRMPAADEIKVEGEALALVRGDVIGIIPKQKDTLTQYRINIEIEGANLSATGMLTGGEWRVSTFPSTVDPREDVEQWRTTGLAKPRRHVVDKLDLRFGSGGFAEALELPIKTPADHFGTIATRKLTFPAGKWRIKTLSDDGIRVWLDDQLIIDDWTHHAPKEHMHEFTIDKPREITLRVEHFELDGYAVLSLDIQAVK